MLMHCDQNDIILATLNLCRLAGEKHVQSDEWHDENLVCVWQVFYFSKSSVPRHILLHYFKILLRKGHV